VIQHRRRSGAAPALPREWAARLPFEVEIGPHRLVVEWRDAEHMSERHATACVDLAAGRIELSHQLSGLALAEALLRCVIRVGHGIRAACSAWAAAAPAHRLATSLVEFARRNPRAWLWFNLLLAQHLPGRPRFDRAVRGVAGPLPALPQRWIIDGQAVRLLLVPVQALDGADGHRDAAQRVIRIDAALKGSDLPVVVLRELTQAMHDAQAGRRPALPAWRSESRGWLRIVRDNPQGWCWLAQAMSVS
jgi:hypothetical protein